MLKKQPPRPIVKGSRVKYQNSLNNTQSVVNNDSAGEEESGEGEEEEESEPEEEEPPAPAKPSVTTSSIRTSSNTSNIDNNDSTTASSYNKTSIRTSRFDRDEKKDTSSAPSSTSLTKTSVGVRRLGRRDLESEPVVTPAVSKVSSRFGPSITTGSSLRNDRISSAYRTDDKKTEDTTSTGRTSLQSRLNPRLSSTNKDEKEDSDTTSSILNRYRPKAKTNDDNNWRTTRKKDVSLDIIGSPHFLLLLFVYLRADIPRCLDTSRLVNSFLVFFVFLFYFKLFFFCVWVSRSYVIDTWWYDNELYFFIQVTKSFFIYIKLMILLGK